MKKFTFTIIVTILLIITTITSGNAIINNIPIVSVYTAKTTTVNDTIVCTGTIEYGKTYSACSATKGIVNSCVSKTGDKIKKGDTLFTVNPVVTETNSIINSDSLQDKERIYSALANGNYDILDDYDAYLENGALPASKNYDASTNSTQEPSKVIATENGIVTATEYNSGEQINAGETVMTIASDNNLQVNLPVGEDNIDKIIIGQNVKITGTAFPEQEFSGEIISIGDSAKQNATVSGKEISVDVIVSINNPTDKLKSGYTAKCSVITKEKQNTLIAPYEMLLSDNDGKEYVYIYNNGKAKKQYVTTGEEYTDGYEILNGLTSYDKIITNPDTINNDNQIIKLKKGLV